MGAERDRLKDAAWKKWGPYVSDRQWGTVREDYSPDGDAWDYITHDKARSYAYRWGEEGIAGVCDSDQFLCLALSLWNGRDAILKERFFGLTNREGNHGEDVKEIYYYLDSTPTHSYMKMLYKYPQAAFPYETLVEENGRRSKSVGEFELIDTGVFNENRYFDVMVEYAKNSPNDLLMRITVYNRGPDTAVIDVIPQIWFRNIWTWNLGSPKPSIALDHSSCLRLEHAQLGTNYLYCDGNPEILFCNNDSNDHRLYGKSTTGFFKDGLHEFVVLGKKDAVDPANKGTKAGVHYRAEIKAGGSEVFSLRLTSQREAVPFQDFAQIFSKRVTDADQFYAHHQTQMQDDDLKSIQRQAFAGMLWSKQYYYFDIPQWLDGDPGRPPPPDSRKKGRNRDWRHLNNADVISMPDKWEYPWYAAWDLAFHCLPMAILDPEFAKEQLLLLTREWYMHPNGQLPAYEWQFSDVNPPVHAWATWRVFQIDRRHRGDHGDVGFLERVFHKLLLNFTWWVNRKDAQGRNIFQGGFLGLDNIGVFDRSKPLPTGGYINQADATSWMGMYCLNLMRIALELALHNPVYEDIATKFFEHFLQIAEAMTNIGDGGYGLWNDADNFFYDVLNDADDKMVPLKVRSMVGLIPLFAVETLEPELLERLPEFNRRLKWFLEHRPELAKLVSRWNEPGRGERRLLSLLRGHRMKQLLIRMLDEDEFLSPYGIRALSKFHEKNPYMFSCDGAEMSVVYRPGESDSNLFGGNSNWRGPVWFPVNYLIIESLQRFHHYYGGDFKVECPVGSGRRISLLQVADDLAARLVNLFKRDANGRRPVFGSSETFQKDPHFRDYILFYEYFHGDNGRGVGASHQTGWTGLIAKLLQPRRNSDDNHDKLPLTKKSAPL